MYLEIENDQDLQDAQYLSKCYPEVEYWRKCINDQDLRGFVTDEEDGDEGTVDTHDLSNLLEILENSADATEKDNDDDDYDKEWDEMCQILSQKTNHTNERVPDENEQVQNAYESDDGKEVENYIKRKSSIDLDQNATKRSRLDDVTDESFNLDCSVYSRKNTSSPSILQEMESIDEKKESENHSYSPPPCNFSMIETSPIETSPIQGTYLLNLPILALPSTLLCSTVCSVYQ